MYVCMYVYITSSLLNSFRDNFLLGAHLLPHLVLHEVILFLQFLFLEIARLFLLIHCLDQSF